MFVYLKHNKGIKRITDVCLLDCSRPHCHDVSEDRIDPALWYKVLVLDSLLVDIDTRRVFWTSERLPEASYLHKCHEGELKGGRVLEFFKDRENIFPEGACYDYDPTIDELFETATKVYLELGSLDHNVTKGAYENLLKMLHVFILPRIKFVQKDRASVEVVLKWIERYHESIEDQIQKKDRTKRNTENSLHEQRKHLLEDGKFSKASYIASCDPDFLNVFLPHLEKFIRKCNEELTMFDQEIAPKRNSTTMEDIKRLKDLRYDRDSLHTTVQKAMTAREEIKNIISRKHVKKKKEKKKPKKAQSGSFQLMYVEIAKRLQDINSDIQDLIKTKIKISSVREAVLLTLQELDSDGFSYGYNCRKGSLQSEMDIFDPSHKPEQWITLREKVKLHLQIKQAGFRTEHEKFCQRIILQCQQLYDESKMFSPECTNTSDTATSADSEQTDKKEPLSPASQFLDVIGNQSKDRRSRNFSYEDLKPVTKPVTKPVVTKSNGYTSRWSVGTVSKEKCQSICEDIINHIQDVSYRLALELTPGNIEPQRFYLNKVYVCYEEHVSMEVMPILNDLYERSYLDHCQGLSAWLQKNPISEVCGGEMKILKIIQSSGDSGHSSTESLGEASSDMDETQVKVPLDGMATIGNRNMHEMSLEELYHIYEEQCRYMPATFPAAGDIDVDQSAEGNSSNSDENVDSSTQDSRLTVSASKDADTGRKESCVSLKSYDSVSGSGSMLYSRLGDNNIAISDGLPATEDSPRSAAQGANGCETSLTPAPDSGCQPPPYSEVVLRRPSICPPPAYSTLPPMAENFYQEFSEFKRFIQEEDEECTLFGKLRKMTGIIRYIEMTLTRLRREAGAKAAVSADDLVDVIIFLLCKLDAGLLLKLYAHLNLMIHLSPRFMEGNAHEYSLVTLNVAYQHLFEQSVMQSVTQQ